MNHELSVAEAILTGSLRPWGKENRDEEKYVQLFSRNVRNCKNDPASYFIALITAYKMTGIGIEETILDEFSDLGKTVKDAAESQSIPIGLPLFFNKQTEFYYYLIRNEFAGTILLLQQMVRSMQPIDARYNILKIFKKINYLLYHLKDVSQHDEATDFILVLLRIDLYYLHRELERLFSKSIDFEVLNENELQYLVSRNLPELSFSFPSIIEQYEKTREKVLKDGSQAQQQKSTTDNLNPGSVLIPRPSDFRGTGKSPVNFEDINNAETFFNIEKELFLSKIIDGNYNFINTKGNKNLLAALYHILIGQNYFRKNSYRHPGNFEPAHYRRYLDFRYNVDTAQQFRKCKVEDVEKFKRKYLWIDNIPYCR